MTALKSDFQKSSESSGSAGLGYMTSRRSGLIPLRTCHGSICPWSWDYFLDGRSRSNGGKPPDGPDQVAPSDRCITFGVPRVNGIYSAGLHGYYQIVQTPNDVVLFSENIHEHRIIALDGRPHMPAKVRDWSGDSTAKWQGDTLVADTTNFRTQLHTLGVTAGLHLTERFTRISAEEIRYELTFDDPETWVKPWTAALRLKHTDEHLYEFACHEGNERIMQTILLGDRPR